MKIIKGKMIFIENTSLINIYFKIGNTLISLKHKTGSLVLKNIFAMFILLITPILLYSERCIDYLVLDGKEEIVTYGMDTTHHWWALTSPFSGQYRLIVDSIETDSYKSLKNLVFSPDGNRWACFAQSLTQLYLITNDSVIAVPGTESGEILFSSNSEHLVYSFKYQDEQYIIMNGRTIHVIGKSGNLYINSNATRFAFIVARSDGYVININGNESQVFDQIKPLGFWCSGEMMYAASSGSRWQVYKGNNSISDIYSNISESAINLEGTVAACSVRLPTGEMSVILISDEYYEPLVGKRYTALSDLVLHPSLALVGYKAQFNDKKYVVLNTAEYFCGDLCGKPFFTYDGNELFFIGCDFDCYANINGRKFPIYTTISTDAGIAVKPESRTFAYSTSSTLVVRYLERKEMVSGMMVDEIIAPRYNWRHGRYETLGRINQKLYLMTCTD